MPETITSKEIVKIIEFATTGKSKRITLLQSRVWSRFFHVCDAIEGNPTFRKMAYDHSHIRSLSKTRLTKLRQFLSNLTAEYSADPDLEDLTHQITVILQEQAESKAPDLTSILPLFTQFALRLAEFYSEGVDNEQATWDVKIMTKKRRKSRESDEDWQKDDEDEQASEDEKRYVNILDLICSKIDAYVNYLDARFRFVWTDTEKHKMIYEEEISSGRWKLYYDFHNVFWTIRQNASLIGIIEEISYDIMNEINNTTKSMEAYYLLFTHGRSSK